MKKILVYISSMNASGGIERVISNLMAQWDKKYELYLCTKDEGKSFYPIPDSVNKISLNNELKLDMHNRLQRIVAIAKNSSKSRKDIRRVLNRIKPDYIYTTSPLDAAEVYSSGKIWRKKLVASEHGSSMGYNKVYNAIKKHVYPRIYAISVPNAMDTEIYKSWGSNAVYIPHILTYKAVQKNDLDQKIVLNIGRLTADKQHSRLIHIWSAIKNKNDWRLIVVGNGEEYETLKRLIEELNVKESVTLLPARKDINEIYKKASIFALSSRSEGFGMVLLEAMSFGIPCISFDCPSGPRDVIKDGVNGYLIDNGNDNIYTKKLQEMLLMGPTELSSLGDAAFNTVLNWDNEGILEKWDKLFK